MRPSLIPISIYGPITLSNRGVSTSIKVGPNKAKVGC